MPLSNGATFAGFTIVHLLGSGGMGEVYLAKHPRLPRQDALKVLPTDFSNDPEYRARFNREADLASKLYHPHIVGLHDRGEYEGQLWISMDFIDGQDAARLLDSRYRAGMPIDEVARIVSAVASALDYAHEQRLLHRDVKPSNLMLSNPDGRGHRRTLLTDFGIARPIDDESGLTATNIAIGTVAYSAPEQLMGEPLDGRSDQYSLAATAYHLITGTRLFPHTNQAVVISRHLNAEPPRLSEDRPNLVALDAVLARALSKQPKERFDRCEAFAQAFSSSANTRDGAVSAAPRKQSARHSGDATAAGAPAAKTDSIVDPLASTQAAPNADKSAPSGLPRQGPISEPSESHTTRRRWFVGTAVGVALVTVGALLTWHPWQSEESATPPVARSTAPPRTGATFSGQFTPAPSTVESKPSPPGSQPANIAGMVVMLDPGLGDGDDAQLVPDGRGGTTACQPGGASTADGYPEHTFNWDTTLRIRQVLTELGVRSAMTRGNDNTVGPCVDKRAEIANALQVHPDAIISIHAYNGNASERGFTVVYPSLTLDNNLQSSTADLANAMSDQLEKSDMPPANGDNGLDGRSSLALLNLAQYPAIRVELANLNNAGDAAQAETPEGRQRYADAVVKGIVFYLAQKSK